MEEDKNVEYSGFNFENGYLRLIDDLIKVGLVTDIFKRPKSLILLIDDCQITYFIRESDLIEMYRSLKTVFNQNLSSDLKDGVTSLKKWIDRAYYNSGRVSYEDLMSQTYAKVIVTNGGIIDYLQTKEFSIEWAQDEYSYYNLTRM